MSDRVQGRARIVLDDVSSFGHPFLPLPCAELGTEERNREEVRCRDLSRRRLDEMSDRLCMPVPYLAAILMNLEDRGVIDWRTGEITSREPST